MPSLAGRKFFFGTNADVRPGLQVIDQAGIVEYLFAEMRDDKQFVVRQTLSDHPSLGVTTGESAVTSPRYLLFPRGRVPSPRGIGQRLGGVKYVIDPTPYCLTLACGGLHPSGALIVGELQLPVGPDRSAVDLFRYVARELLHGFTRVRHYWLGPEALRGFRAGQRLVPIGVRSPREYDLTDPRTDRPQR